MVRSGKVIPDCGKQGVKDAMLLTGEYFNKVDDKSRLMIPSRLRTLLSSDTLIVTKGFEEKSLALFTPEMFDKTVSYAVEGEDGMQIFSRNTREFTRRFIAPSQPLDFDKTGRISLPPSLREHALISPRSEVVIIGMGTYVEIWSRDIYDALSDGGQSLADLADAIAKERRS